MGADTKIEWCDHTFNPWTGCTKVAQGCANCYAETLRKRWGKNEWGPDKARTRTSEANWKLPRKWNREAALSHAARIGPTARPRVFCASLADVFEDRADLDEWRNDLFALIRETEYLDWLLLTKRITEAREWLCEEYQGYTLRGDPDYSNPPLLNLWLGYSLACKADLGGVSQLIAAPAVLRFLSIEPLIEDLGNIQQVIGHWTNPDGTGSWFSPVPGKVYRPLIDWVIVGGESGPGARPCDVAWIRSIVDQCKAAGVPAFVKQVGANAIYSHSCDVMVLRDRKGGDPSEWPADLRVREFPATASREGAKDREGAKESEVTRG